LALPAQKGGKLLAHSSNKLPKYLGLCEKRKEKFEIKMEGKASWQPIAMGGAEFNEIWDDTELIKAFSKSINYYKVLLASFIRGDCAD
jgi:hypothetical protein